MSVTIGHDQKKSIRLTKDRVLTTIRDYFNDKALHQMQETFSTAIGAPVSICAPDGSVLIGDRPADGPAERANMTAAIRVDDEIIGQLMLLEPSPNPPGAYEPVDLQGRPQGCPPTAEWVASFLKLMAAMLASLCSRQKTLRLRVEELSTLYRLTAEFTGQRDLQSVLDTVTATVVKLLGAKACTIRLLSDDGRELLIKSANNVDDRHLVKGPILLEDSKIDYEAITAGKIVYIPDVEKDSRVLFPEGARAEGLVSALCVPLVYKGQSLGVIRVYKAQEYRFDRFEHALLFAVAAQAAAAIVNTQLQTQAIQTANIKRQLRLAGDVQARMFPHEKPTIAGMDIGAAYQPCFELGGDFYDFIPLGQGHLGIAACDVVGKGIRASLLMASIRAALRAHAANVYDISEILRRVNADLCATTEVADFATLFYGVIDSQSQRFTYVNAGHPPPLLFRDGRTCPLTTGGGILGTNPQGLWQHGHFTLHSGDTLVIYTDGVTEALSFQDEAFGSKRLEHAIHEGLQQDLSASGLTQHILWHVRNFVGLQRQADDLTIVVIKVQ